MSAISQLTVDIKDIIKRFLRKDLKYKTESVQCYKASLEMLFLNLSWEV